MDEAREVLSVDPVIGAIAASNAAVLKHSEIAPTTSSLLAKYLGQYMDTSAIQVVEGGIPETSALLGLKLNKIVYTEIARRESQKKRRRQKWIWSSIVVAITLGSCFSILLPPLRKRIPNFLKHLNLSVIFNDEASTKSRNIGRNNLSLMHRV